MMEMNISYLIDFNCPLSYIGLERIKKASENLNLDVEWEIRPLELDPIDTKVPASSTAKRYVEKYGLSPKEALDEISQIEEIASDDGLKINYKDMSPTSSNDALRLCKFCQSTHGEITLKLAREIFHSNFIENKNIADINLLRDIAISCGLEESEVNRILENDFYSIEVYLDIEEAVLYGINTTPCFIVNNKGERLIIPGVLSTEEFETALKDLIDGKIEEKTFV